MFLAISAVYGIVVLNNTRNELNKKATQIGCSHSQGKSVLKIIICKSAILITFVLPWRIL